MTNVDGPSRAFRPFGISPWLTLSFILAVCVGTWLVTSYQPPDLVVVLQAKKLAEDTMRGTTGVESATSSAGTRGITLRVREREGISPEEHQAVIAFVASAQRSRQLPRIRLVFGNGVEKVLPD